MIKEKKEEDDEQEETAANVEDETKTEDQLAPEDEVPPPPAEEISNDDQVSAKVKRLTVCTRVKVSPVYELNCHFRGRPLKAPPANPRT